MLIVESPKRHGKSPVITRQRKQLVLNFIHEYRRVNQGVNPTFAEIAKGIGYTETSEGTVHHTLVEPLIEEGWLYRIAPGARMIAPSKLATETYCPITDPDLKAIAKKQRNLRILRRL